jgi:hypothetical protein
MVIDRLEVMNGGVILALEMTIHCGMNGRLSILTLLNHPLPLMRITWNRRGVEDQMSSQR